jgi:hypothetical protein
MSMLKEQGSFFGMSEASMEKSAGTGSEDLDQNPQPVKPVSQVPASRQLGLAPTELDLGASILDDTTSGNSAFDKTSQHSKSLPAGVPVDAWEHDSKRDHLALRTDTGPSSQSGSQQESRPVNNNAKTETTGKLGPTMSTPVNLADFQNILNRLEPVKPPADKDLGADIPIRRRRAQARPLSVSSDPLQETTSY